MTLYFVTGNKGKFDEVQAIIKDVEQLDIDLAEIQSDDPKVIIEAKLREARISCKGEILVEDTSLYFDGMGNLPGPLIKWFIKSLGILGLYKLSKNTGSAKARAVTIFGYLDSSGIASFYAVEISGQIVAPRGNFGFGWDPIFQPDESNLTFAEMTKEEKLSTKNNMRRIALTKFQKSKLI